MALRAYAKGHYDLLNRGNLSQKLSGNIDGLLQSTHCNHPNSHFAHHENI